MDFIGNPDAEDIVKQTNFTWYNGHHQQTIDIDDDEDATDEQVFEATENAVKDLIADAHFRLAQRIHSEIDDEIKLSDWYVTSYDVADTCIYDLQCGCDRDWREDCDKDIRYWMEEEQKNKD